MRTAATGREVRLKARRMALPRVPAPNADHPLRAWLKASTGSFGRPSRSTPNHTPTGALWIHLAISASRRIPSGMAIGTALASGWRQALPGMPAYTRLMTRSSPRCDRTCFTWLARLSPVRFSISRLEQIQRLTSSRNPLAGRDEA